MPGQARRDGRERAGGRQREHEAEEADGEDEEERRLGGPPPLGLGERARYVRDRGRPRGRREGGSCAGRHADQRRARGVGRCGGPRGGFVGPRALSRPSARALLLSSRLGLRGGHWCSRRRDRRRGGRGDRRRRRRGQGRRIGRRRLPVRRTGHSERGRERNGYRKSFRRNPCKRRRKPSLGLSDTRCKPSACSRDSFRPSDLLSSRCSARR